MDGPRPVDEVDVYTHNAASELMNSTTASKVDFCMTIQHSWRKPASSLSVRPNEAPMAATSTFDCITSENTPAVRTPRLSQPTEKEASVESLLNRCLAEVTDGSCKVSVASTIAESQRDARSELVSFPIKSRAAALSRSAALAAGVSSDEGSPDLTSAYQIRDVPSSRKVRSKPFLRLRSSLLKNTAPV